MDKQESKIARLEREVAKLTGDLSAHVSRQEDLAKQLSEAASLLVALRKSVPVKYAPVDHKHAATIATQATTALIPAAVIIGEVEYGLSPSAGSMSDSFARADHTHGSPPVPVDGVPAHVLSIDPHGQYQKESEKGASNGYAGLDAASKVPVINLGGSGADNTKYLRGDQTWATPASGPGGVSELWKGKVHATYFDGDPVRAAQLGLSNNATISPTFTPTNIGATVGRLVAFRFDTAITVATIRWYGVGATTNLHGAAIYRDSDGARLWQLATLSTVANTWSNSAAGLPITLNADALYWFGISAVTTGTVAGFCGMALPRVASYGLAAPNFAGLTNIGLRFCQVALTAGAWPAALPSKTNAAAWTGFVPPFFLCATGN